MTKKRKALLLRVREEACMDCDGEGYCAMMGIEGRCPHFRAIRRKHGVKPIALVSGALEILMPHKRDSIGHKLACSLLPTMARAWLKEQGVLDE